MLVIPFSINFSMESSDRRGHSLRGMEWLAALPFLGAGNNYFRETAENFDFWFELLLSHHSSNLMAALKRLACFEVLFIVLFCPLNPLGVLLAEASEKSWSVINAFSAFIKDTFPWVGEMQGGEQLESVPYVNICSLLCIFRCLKIINFHVLSPTAFLVRYEYFICMKCKCSPPPFPREFKPSQNSLALISLVSVCATCLLCRSLPAFF